MSSSYVVIWRLLILLSIPILLIAALTLLKIALFPRRRGSDPHCAACNYLLIGNQSGRCPECGHDIFLPNGIRLGQRHRRPVLAIVGLLLLLLALLPVAGLATVMARQIDWYQYRPASWLVQDLTSSNFPQSNRAWNELDRRRKSPAGLSPSIEQKLIDLALKDQAQPTQGPVGTELVNFLGDLFLANKLTKAQTDLLFTQAMSIQLTARPTVIVGDDAPYLISHTGRTPSNNNSWWCRNSNLQVKIDDQVTRNGGGSSTSSGSGGGSSGSWVKVTTPGKHTIETTNRLEFYHGPWDEEKDSRLCYSRTITLKTDFQALEKAPADYVKLIDDPTLQPLMQSAITVSQLERSPSGYVHLMINVKNAPANVAFDVFARADGKEYPLGSLALPKARQCSFGLNTSPLSAVTADKLDFILRSSEPVARRTTDLFEIWSGQVLLEGIPVKPRPQ